jgi:hypothetical protein
VNVTGPAEQFLIDKGSAPQSQSADSAILDGYQRVNHIVE